MWILVLWMAGANPPVADYGYFMTKSDCYQVADWITKGHEQERDAFCILGAETWAHRIVVRRQ